MNQIWVSGLYREWWHTRMNPNLLFPFHASQGFLLKVSTYRISWGWERHTLQWIRVAFVINGKKQHMKEDKKLMKMSIKLFNCSEGKLMRTFIYLFIYFWIWVQMDSSLPRRSLAPMLDGQGKRRSISTRKSWCFCSKTDCDFSDLLKLILFSSFWQRLIWLEPSNMVMAFTSWRRC